MVITVTPFTSFNVKHLKVNSDQFAQRYQKKDVQRLQEIYKICQDSRVEEIRVG